MKMSTSTCLKFLIIFLFTHEIGALKIFQFSPGWSNSHVLFNYRLSKTLITHGHNVTLLIPLLSGQKLPGQCPDGIDQIVFDLPMSTSETQRKALISFQAKAFENRKSSYKSIVIQCMYWKSLSTTTCDQLLSNHDLLEKLRLEKFDIILAHNFDPCPIGLAHRVGIRKFVTLAPGAFMMDYVYWINAYPYNPSVFPSVWSDSSDRMPFMERMRNLIYVIISTSIGMGSGFTKTENHIFTKPPYNERNDPSIWDVVQETKAVLINGELSMDFPKALVPGMMYLGDLEKKQLKPLDQDWQRIVNASDKGLIIFSLGTIANTSAMPMRMKEAFFNAFNKFPQYTIIWRLDGQLPKGLDQYQHIKIVKWIPQRDLLYHPKTKLFITHAGYNSLLESGQAGVPMLMMPLFADQYSNAKRTVNRGVGLLLDKSAEAIDIEESIRSILTNSSFKSNARKLSNILNDHIMDNQLLAVRQIERIATKRFWPTMKAAQNLNFLQYICLDVIIAFCTLISICIWFIYKSIRRIWIIIQYVRHRYTYRNIDR